MTGTRGSHVERRKLHLCSAAHLSAATVSDGSKVLVSTREALRLYEDDLAEKFETAKPNSMERIEMGAKKASAQTLIARLSRRLPLYAD